jgi:vesicle coat complex subunit
VLEKELDFYSYLLFHEMTDVSKDLSSQGFIGAESRKGEIIQLRDNLQTAIDKRDVPGQVQAMHKIIEAMTLGSDCSEIFLTIIMV